MEHRAPDRVRAGCPVTVAGMTVNRFCTSGLQTIAFGAQHVMTVEAEVIVAGGFQSISCVRKEMHQHRQRESRLAEHKPEIHRSMRQTAATVATRYGMSRERQDEYGTRSQQIGASAGALL